MKLFKLIICCLFLINVIACSSKAHEVNSRVIVVGEDEDLIAIPKDNEIYKRVIAKIQESLMRHKIFVVDEDMISVKLGFEMPKGRSKSKILQMLQVANTTTDATVKSRLLVLFSIIPNVQNMEFTKQLSVRVRGQIFDLASLRALSSFEVKNDETVPVPKKESLCNKLCVQEKAGELAASLARELGEVLVIKLEKLIEGETSSDGTNKVVKDSALGNIFNLKLILFKKSETLRIKSKLEATDKIKEVKLQKGSQTETIYSVSTNLNIGQIEEEILLVLMSLGIDIDKDVRIKAFGNDIKIEKL